MERNTCLIQSNRPCVLASTPLITQPAENPISDAFTQPLTPRSCFGPRARSGVSRVQEPSLIMTFSHLSFLFLLLSFGHLDVDQKELRHPGPPEGKEKKKREWGQKINTKEGEMEGSKSSRGVRRLRSALCWTNQNLTLHIL